MARRLLVIVWVLMAALVTVSGVHAEEQLKNQVTAYLRPGAAENKAVLEVWASNVNPIIGITMPFKFGVKNDSLVLDSLDTKDTRAEGYALIRPVYRPENQTLLINMISGLDKNDRQPPIPPGTGPVLTLYLSTGKKFPMKDFKMVAAELPPQNVLLYVTSSYNSVTPVFKLSHDSPPAEWDGQPQSSGSGNAPKGKS